MGGMKTIFLDVADLHALLHAMLNNLGDNLRRDKANEFSKKKLMFLKNS